MKKLIRLLLSLSFVFIVFIIIPNIASAQLPCQSETLDNNCYGLNQRDTACPPSYECIKYDPAVPPKCQPCTGCSQYGNGCINTSECCDKFCNPVSKICEFPPEGCTIAGLLCNPNTGAGDFGPCCPNLTCGQNSATLEYACTYPGRVCLSLRGECAGSCPAGLSPADPSIGGPGVDCPSVSYCCLPDSGNIIPTRGPLQPNLQPVFCNTSGGYSKYPHSNGYIKTAIGCIATANNRHTITLVTRWAMGIGGGLAFMLIVYSGFLIITSSGDPRKLNAGKELFAAAVAGLLLLVLGGYLLKLIGVEVLGLF